MNRAPADARTVAIWSESTPSPDDRLPLEDAAALVRVTVRELRAAGARRELDIRGPQRARVVRRGDLLAWAPRDGGRDVE